MDLRRRFPIRGIRSACGAAFGWWLCLAALLLPAGAQERGTPGRTRIDVEKYVIDANLDPRGHRLRARAQIQFVAQEEALNVTFELNNNLSPTRVTDSSGAPVMSQRFQQEGTVRLNFERPLPKGQRATVNFEYEGTLKDAENQPVEGIKLAYIGEEVSYLLYAGRWFPVSGYQVDRFTAELNVTVPAGLRVIGPGRSSAGAAGATRFVYDQPAFPGSLAVVREPPQRVNSGGAPVDVYFRDAEKTQAQTYGDAAGKILAFYSSKFGPANSASLSLVEIDAGSVNGYSGPGMIFLSPRGIGNKLNYRLLSHELAHQWWRGLVSPASRSHLWLDEGLATFSELLYVEELAGKAALEEVARDFSITALTNEKYSIVQAVQTEEFSPEYDAVVAKKGAMVMHMLRWVTGDEAFFNGLRQFAASFAGRSASTDDLRKTFEKAAGKDLTGFFTQWMDSTGAPEFKADYTTYRTPKGFKIVGKIKQDMDLFRMPVEIRIDTDGDPELKRVDVVGTASDFMVETFGRPRKVTVDPENRLLKFSDTVRLQVATRKGQQAADLGDYELALKEYQKALDLNKNSSLAHFRIGEVFFAQSNYQSAANAFRESLNGDQEPRWTEVWSHINLGKIFDITGQRERALNEYNQAARTRDDTQGAQAEAQKYRQRPYQRERRPE